MPNAPRAGDVIKSSPVKSLSRRSFRVPNGSKSSSTRPARSSIDGVLAAQKGGNSSEAKLTSRVRSDSALASLRRRQDQLCIPLEVQDQLLDTPIWKDSGIHQRNAHDRRMSFEAANFGPQFHLDHKRSDGFYDVFGILGIPMLFFFLSTSLAVLTQAYIQVFPTQFANYLMNTAAYDSGEFWMFPGSEPVPTFVATMLLVAFASCYLYLATYMVFFRHHAIAKKKPRASVTSSSRANSTISTRTPLSSPSKKESARGFRFPELSSTQLLRLLVPALLWPEKNLNAVVTFPDSALSKAVPDSDASGKNVVPVDDKTITSDEYKEKRPRSLVRDVPVREIYMQFVSPTGVYHAYYNVLYDAPKLVFQSITLLAYLRKGFPIALTAFYASLLTFNYLISFYRFQRKRVDHNLIITRLFYLFDLFFAAFAPIIVLAYSYYNFQFDRDVQQSKFETLPPGAFDSIARLYADPVEVSVFNLTFGSMRLTTGSTIFTKCSLLLLSVFKWQKIIKYLVQLNHLEQRQMKGHFPQVLKHSSSRRHLLFGIFVFVFFGVAIVLYTAGSIMTSTQHCKPYKQHCVGISYHWVFPDESCPCLLYINRNPVPKTFEEWGDPLDTTAELAIVAKMGELRTIQIINRKLPSLPESLRACKKLEQLILLYTKTEIIPVWANELVFLEYLHIEGDYTSSLKEMPRNLFTHMDKLTFLHTGTIPYLTEYPSLDGLVNLHTLTIAVIHSMQELPSFDKLAKLRVLVLVDPASVLRLPSLRPLKNIKQISIMLRSAMCCNGFLTPGKCDLSNYQCLPQVDESSIHCSDESIPDADATILKMRGTPYCPVWAPSIRAAAPSRESTDVACGGVLFRQCQLGNVTGICYNGRMQVVYCDTTGKYEKMRRLQIQRQVGIPCDPSVETWLGCKQP